MILKIVPFYLFTIGILCFVIAVVNEAIAVNGIATMRYRVGTYEMGVNGRYFGRHYGVDWTEFEAPCSNYFRKRP